MAEDTTLATRLIAAMSLTSTDTTVDGLELRPEDSLLAPLAEDCAIAALKQRTEARPSPRRLWLAAGGALAWIQPIGL